MAIMLLAGFGSFGAATAAAPESVRVVSVLDGDTLLVDPSAGGRQEVRLMGVQAPKPFPDGSESWLVAHAEAAQRNLVDLVEGATLTLLVAEQRTNRYGQLLAQAHRADGLWVQGELLRRGSVRVQTLPATAALAAEMLAIEAEARQARRGLWADRRFAVRTPEAVARDIGTFQLVEGRVRTASRVQGRVYVNFGDDWRSDFTVSMPARLASAMARDGFEPLALAGRMVRVRGWLDELNGPMIELTHREQIEVLNDDTPPQPQPPGQVTPPAVTAAPAAGPVVP